MDSRLEEVREFVQDSDRDLQRTFDFVVDEVRASGDATAAYNVRGHASVFNKWSLDLGGFREKVAKGAFDSVLSRDPHVLHLWDHDSRYVLSSTRNKTLELRVDPIGLHYYSRVAKTSYAEDLRVLLDRGDISQSSFAFTVEKDEWRITEQDGEEIVERVVLEIKDLFDVTTTAMGAYPTTDAALAMRNLLAKKREKPLTVTNIIQNPPVDPRVFSGTATTTTSGTSSVVVRKDEAAETVAPEPVGAPQPPVAPEEGGESTNLAQREALRDLKKHAKDEVAAALRRYHRKGKSDE